MDISRSPNRGNPAPGRPLSTVGFCFVRAARGVRYTEFTGSQGQGCSRVIPHDQPALRLHPVLKARMNTNAQKEMRAQQRRRALPPTQFCLIRLTGDNRARRTLGDSVKLEPMYMYVFPHSCMLPE